MKTEEKDEDKISMKQNNREQYLNALEDNFQFKKVKTLKFILVFPIYFF